MSETHTFIH